MSEHIAIWGDIFHFQTGPEDYTYIEGGIIWIENGLIKKTGPADIIRPLLPENTKLIDHRGHLLMPGFIDAHVHYPQVDVIASFGTQLIDWLNTYTFPAETAFADETHASRTADFFLDQLLRNGTTTALVLPTVHKSSVDIFFNAARNLNLRMICGKVLMDRHAPDALLDTPETGYAESEALIKTWHNQHRLRYALTPRFAPTSTPEQLEMAGQLLKKYPDIYMHTHLSENPDEVVWVKQLFPEHDDYLGVYEDFGLLHRRSVFAHGIYLSESERKRLAGAGATIAFCPTSNLFIGSGLFDLASARNHQIHVAMATDVGGGSSFSMLRTMDEAYKVCQLSGQNLSALDAYYLATLGSAKALDMDDKIGNFEKGKEADIVAWNLSATPLLSRRSGITEKIEEKLFALMILGDDRNVAGTYIMGQKSLAQ